MATPKGIGVGDTNFCAMGRTADITPVFTAWHTRSPSGSVSSTESANRARSSGTRSCCSIRLRSEPRRTGSVSGGGRLYPRALALRDLVSRALAEVLSELEGERALLPLRTFIVRYSSGGSVTSAARELGLSREHCSRSVKRRALLLLAERFAVIALERRRSAAEGPLRLPKAS